MPNCWSIFHNKRLCFTTIAITWPIGPPKMAAKSNCPEILSSRCRNWAPTISFVKSTIRRDKSWNCSENSVSRKFLFSFIHPLTIALFHFPDPLTIENDVMPQKIIRQCLRQFDLLKNVWQTILPDDVYTTSLATLLNEFCVEIIRRICAIEDIPSSVSHGLVDILDIIIDRAPTIFQVSCVVNHRRPEQNLTECFRL